MQRSAARILLPLPPLNYFLAQSSSRNLHGTRFFVNLWFASFRSRETRELSHTNAPYIHPKPWNRMQPSAYCFQSDLTPKFTWSPETPNWSSPIHLRWLGHKPIRRSSFYVAWMRYGNSLSATSLPWWDPKFSAKAIHTEHGSVSRFVICRCFTGCELLTLIMLNIMFRQLQGDRFSMQFCIHD